MTNQDLIDEIHTACPRIDAVVRRLKSLAIPATELDREELESIAADLRTAAADTVLQSPAVSPRPADDKGKWADADPDMTPAPPAPPPVAPPWCEVCRRPQVEVQPGVWACTSPAANPMEVLRRIFGQRMQVVDVGAPDGRRHKA